MELLQPVLFLIPIFFCIDGYPTGARSGTCGPMLPNHIGAYPQHTPSPYSLRINSKTFYPGRPVTVSIVGPQYKGLLLLARSHHGDKALGSWQLPPPDTKFLNCSNNPRGAMTHSNRNLKSVATVYSWVPPDLKENIYFMATVVQERTLFWVHLTSKEMARGTGTPPALGISDGEIALATGGQAGLAEQTSMVALLMSFLIFLVLG